MRDNIVRSHERRRGLLQDVQERNLQVYNNRPGANNDNNSNSVPQVMGLAESQAYILQMHNIRNSGNNDSDSVPQVFGASDMQARILQLQQAATMGRNIDEMLESGGNAPDMSEAHGMDIRIAGRRFAQLQEQPEQQIQEARTQPRRPMLPPGNTLDPADHERIVGYLS